MTQSDLDEDALVAAVDLTGRAGARNFQIGWSCPHTPAVIDDSNSCKQLQPDTDDDDDDHSCPDVRWYAYAQYRGARITVENFPGPTEAAEALARRLLTGGRCRCGKLVALSSQGATVFDNVLMADGSRWTGQQAAQAGQCRWTRMGRRWEPSCDAPPIKLSGRR